MSLLIKGGRVVDPANSFDAVSDVLVTDGRIAKVGKHLKAPEGAETVDARFSRGAERRDGDAGRHCARRRQRFS